MHYMMFRVEICKSPKCSFCNLSKNIDSHWTKVARDSVQRTANLLADAFDVAGRFVPDVHIFHAHYNIITVAQKSAVEIDNVVRVALMHDM